MISISTNCLIDLNLSKLWKTIKLLLFFYSEIDENSAGISEEIEKCKESALEKKKGLEEAREQVEKAAYAVLEMLNNRP